MNAHVRDQLNALKTPAGGYSLANEASDYTTSSTSFADVDSTDMALTITTGGGDVEVHFVGSVANGAVAGRTHFDIYESVAGARYGGDDGLLCITSQSSTSPVNASFSVRVPSLSAGEHTFKLQWKVSANTSTLFAGAGR